eukprot:TRINITY_DN13402_c0_g1_i1.p1 TRINITY_DN13402_c0_g1~~TRINITY_DN13402_c0_g1_i1.p1  ORF type:complete len:175 (+),score=29.67 TRINITY_DN13402_c0_g1_i1:26-526(+)
MEPIPLFDGPNPSRATWVQGEETVTITVPLPEASSSLEVHRPTVSIRPRRLCVTTSIACCDSSRTGEAAGESSGAPEQTTLLDNELSGEVSVEEHWVAGVPVTVQIFQPRSTQSEADPQDDDSLMSSPQQMHYYYKQELMKFLPEHYQDSDGCDQKRAAADADEIW